MDYNRLASNTYKTSLWSEWKRMQFFEQAEVATERMTYNTSIVQNTNLVMDLERLQNRYLLLANRGLAFVDTFDFNHPDATILPECLNPRKGLIADLSWFPTDNSLSATVHNTGKLDLIDMNNLDIVETFDLKLPSHCLSFDSTGTFPFSIAVGTRIGVRICDLKSGTMIQTLKSKFDATCLCRHHTQPSYLFSGHSDGSLTRWDLRKANTPVAAIRIGQGPLRQIALKPSTTGFIHAGGANGSLSAVDVDCSRITWSVLTETNGQSGRMFCISNSSDLIVPESGLIRFVDAFTGELLHSSLHDCLHEPSSILLNEFNSDFMVADNHYLGQLYKFRAKHRLRFDQEAE